MAFTAAARAHFATWDPGLVDLVSDHCQCFRSRFCLFLFLNTTSAWRETVLGIDLPHVFELLHTLIVSFSTIQFLIIKKTSALVCF